MAVQIRLVGDTAAREIVELRDWLSREDELRGHVQAVPAAIEADEMGGLVEVLMVTLGANGAGATLAASLSVWIKHRRPTVKIEVKHADGREVTIDLRNAPDLDVPELLDAMLAG
ncbi:effector-associated constant component EACC1 [Nocardia macrotermitis]|uniref:Uncharacterized protein n=1 Tax=Nocardia macrotermitis TaxID=2585198 RepID=A0A7K0D2H5_9NOCA|nr:hypothetical protein [Nocardia macrotermitis]MQY19861.1 hypothetical protein [Nocardia macrotermitis]